MSQEAVCVLIGDEVSGTINFSTTGDVTTVSGEVTGLSPGEHGFHIHVHGDTTSGCASTGGHYNPDGSNHGGPTAPKGERHAGDLGNVTAGEDGVATVSKTASNIPVSHIVGRAVVVHAGEDDFGLGGHDDSLSTGHAGGRVACGVIGLK